MFSLSRNESAAVAVSGDVHGPKFKPREAQTAAPLFGESSCFVTLKKAPPAEREIAQVRNCDACK